MDYIYNLKKSPKDKRDFIFKSNNGLKLPEEFDLRRQLQPIRDQGKQGSCYAQATACMKEYHEKIDNEFDEYMSPQFFYNNRPNIYDNNGLNDEGMYGRDVMKLLKTIGICRESSYPYGRIETKFDIPSEIFEEAKEYIIESYARVNTKKTLKECLFTNGPCLIAFPVYNNGPEFWKKKSRHDKMSGGHAVAVVGYNKDGFIIRNSWGTRWGDKGYTLYKYSDWGSHWEIWSTVDVDMDNIYFPSRDNCCLQIRKLFSRF